jgi:hypothetical protein
MTDPFSPPIMAKVASGVGGFIGGATFMAFLRPKGVWDAAIRSSVSTTAAIIGAAVLCEWLEVKMTTDHLVAAGAVIGFCAWSVLSLIARTLLKIQDEKTTIKLPAFIQKE